MVNQAFSIKIAYRSKKEKKKKKKKEENNRDRSVPDGSDKKCLITNTISDSKSNPIQSTSAKKHNDDQCPEFSQPNQTRPRFGTFLLTVPTNVVLTTPRLGLKIFQT